jgi:hypothetical protein
VEALVWIMKDDKQLDRLRPGPWQRAEGPNDTDPGPWVNLDNAKAIRVIPHRGGYAVEVVFDPAISTRELGKATLESPRAQGTLAGQQAIHRVLDEWMAMQGPIELVKVVEGTLEQTLDGLVVEQTPAPLP